MKCTSTICKLTTTKNQMYGIHRQKPTVSLTFTYGRWPTHWTILVFMLFLIGSFTSTWRKSHQSSLCLQRHVFITWPLLLDFQNLEFWIMDNRRLQENLMSMSWSMWNSPQVSDRWIVCMKTQCHFSVNSSYTVTNWHII